MCVSGFMNLIIFILNLLYKDVINQIKKLARNYSDKNK